MATGRLAAMVWCSLLMVGGCAKPLEPSGSRPRSNAAAEERTWGRQVQDVRDGRSTQIRIEAHSVGLDEWNQLLQGCDLLHSLEVARAGIGDDDLQVVVGLPGLRRLKLGAPIGDVGARHLVTAENLEILNLPEADLTDSGIAALATLPHLQLLRIRSPRVTDAGLTHIAGMKSLRFLHLIDVPVTDVGLEHLHGMTWLESFYLDGGLCTEDGLSALIRALPDLHFHKDQLHLPGDPRADAHQ